MCANRHTQQGFSLIEVLVFIIIVGVAASAMLSVMSRMMTRAATLMPEQQAQAAASALMHEILAQPFTFCDPDDPVAASAVSPAACAVAETAFAPEAGETRTVVPRFDNVNDYHGYAPNPLVLPDGTIMPGFQATVTVASAGLITGIPAAERLMVTVTVTPPVGVAVVQRGLRLRYEGRT